jgi:hypothetical protein
MSVGPQSTFCLEQSDSRAVRVLVGMTLVVSMPRNPTSCEVGELLIPCEGREVEGPQENKGNELAMSGGRALSSARGGPP